MIFVEIMLHILWDKKLAIQILIGYSTSSCPSFTGILIILSLYMIPLIVLLLVILWVIIELVKLSVLLRLRLSVFIWTEFIAIRPLILLKLRLQLSHLIRVFIVFILWIRLWAQILVLRVSLTIMLMTASG